MRRTSPVLTGEPGMQIRNKKYICAVDRRVESDRLAPQGMLPPGSDRPSWLWRVLSAAAEHRDRTDPTRPLILVIDGLDEAEPVHTGTMPFGLPSNLPLGVFVVATTRTGTSLPALRQPYRIRLLKADSDVNEWDMDRYLAAQILEPRLAKRLDEARSDPKVFSQQLLGRCSGVWIYLNCVLTEIRYGLVTWMQSRACQRISKAITPKTLQP